MHSDKNNNKSLHTDKGNKSNINIEKNNNNNMFSEEKNNRDNGKFRDGTYSLTAPSIDLANVCRWYIITIMLVMVFIIIIIIFLVIVFIIIITMFDGNQEQSYSLVETRYLKRIIYNTPRMCLSSDFGMNQDTPRGKAKNVPILIYRWQRETLASTTAQQAALMESPKPPLCRFRWWWWWCWWWSSSSLSWSSRWCSLLRLWRWWWRWQFLEWSWSALRISFDDISLCNYRVIFKISLKYWYRIFLENITRYW